SLNCAEGPTPTPCEKCDSCVALAPNGPGSLDVIEIDAASHGLVDDARDLRERAFFAPVSSTYKIYIIDEAHMISQAAFNALLKVVEEPPPHVKFIFATTEPEKVLSTIKSRTFHYRFRLIPPAVLREFLADLCAREGITVDPLVLPLVVRAGAGSARDALSVLDQLAAGAEDSGISYPRALAILGYTDAALLDETVDAFAAADGASVFRAVDRVVEAGIDPRRFAQDLLERFRDLLVLDAVADAGETGLLDLPADTVERMRSQAGRLGRAALTRAGDVMAQALVDMRGTTSPRLVLELACARILLPGGDGDVSALLARLDRLERRLSVTGAPPVQPAQPADPAPAAAPPVEAPAPPVPKAAPQAAPEPEPEPEPTPAAPAPGGLDLPALRRIWPDLLDAVNTRSKTANALLRNAEPSAVDAKAITLSFTTAQLAKMFADKAEFLREALRDVIGLDVKVNAVVGAASTPAFADEEPSPEPEPDPDPTDSSAQPTPQDTEDPLTRLQRDLGAEVVNDPQT
ncbi:MAG: DNA polymerase III subunit gamma/tau, partial [Frankiaceae bacterium]|nr:DNA polymerase III subunit gamma/tau [Frankiaceae bacterium]